MGDEKLLDSLQRIAWQASDLVMEVYRRDFRVDYKGPQDPVTRADRDANDFICERLSREFPDAAIVAEESPPGTFEGYRSRERVFFVDPLDGTREFVAKNGEFVVMIGMVEGERARVGVIVAPGKATSWTALVGQGAWRHEAGSKTAIHVSQQSTLVGARCVVSRSRTSPTMLAEMNQRALVPIRLGSAGLKATAVAEGAADIYCAPGMAGSRWDSCAADALITAAGGRYTDASGNLYNYRANELMNRDGIAATNDVLHPMVLELLSRVRAARRKR